MGSSHKLKGGGERMAFSERKLKACASFWPWGKSFWQVIFNHFSKYAFDMTELWPHHTATQIIKQRKKMTIE